MSIVLGDPKLKAMWQNEIGEVRSHNASRLVPSLSSAPVVSLAVLLCRRLRAHATCLSDTVAVDTAVLAPSRSLHSAFGADFHCGCAFVLFASQMSGRIIKMRTLLRDNLKAVGSKKNWDHITNQIGMRCT